MEDFVNEYYSVERFKNAYKRQIEPLHDKSEWPQVDYASVLGAPLGKRGVGRQRKNRIKGALEGGGGSKKKAVEKEKIRIKGPTKCKNCGEFGHRQTSYKCPFNGTKKRNRKPRKSTTNSWFPVEVSTPTREANAIEAIVQESPGVVTRRRLAALMEESSSSQPITQTSSPTKQPAPKKVVKKMTPKKKKNA